MTRVAITYGGAAKLPPYERALRRVSLEPVRNPESLDGLEGLLLTGGSDVDPELYRERPGPETQTPDRARDRLECKLVREALDRDLPVLAICRGMQLLNVALGGALIQHLENADRHAVRDRAPEADVHFIEVAAGTKLAAIMEPGGHPVNSRHHQAIGELAPGLVCSAVSDGVMEALEHPGRRFVLAVQWHPEDRPDSPADRRLFESFAAAVQGR